MIITTYSEHVRFLSSEVCASKVHSGLGADIVYAIITLKFLAVPPLITDSVHTAKSCD